jgi:trimeric autotransporter adhesin
MSKARDLADSVAAGSVLADGVVSLSEVGGGTNNGVVFVNGGGTTTSGSALTFDGTNLGIGTPSPVASLDIQNSTSVNQLRLQTNKTNSTNKSSAIITGHYTNSEEGLLTVGGFSTSTEGVVYLGGGYGTANAATTVLFFTAANNTTTTGIERLRIASNGDISFYEDTGTTAKFFWDASAESLGIGTSSPASGYRLDVAGAMRLGEGANLSWGNTYAGNGPTVAGSSAGGFLAFYPNGSASGETMRLTSTSLYTASGINVGIGTSSPAGKLDVTTDSTNDGGIYLTADGSSFGYASNLYFRSKLTSGGSIGVAAKIRAELSSSNNAGLLFFTTASGTNAERMRLDSSGELTTTNGKFNLITVGRGAGAVATNTAVGASALAANTSGSVNSAFGYQAGYSLTTGTFNNFFGQNSAYYQTTGSYNIAIGQGALQGVSGESNTGSNNTAVGNNALLNNTTASRNTAVGYQSAYSNTTGADNTALGNLAGYSTSTGISNVAVGGGNPSSYYPTLWANTTGSYNTAVGISALGQNTTASGNTAVGYQAAYSLTTEGFNTCIGYQAGYSNTTGAYNTFVGQGAGFSYNPASPINGFNTFIGQGSGDQVTTGTKNTIIGRYSGNQGGLDIRIASNYIVLSDGDGNPRGFFDNTGRFLINTTTSGYGSVGANTLTAVSGSSSGAALFYTNYAGDIGTAALKVGKFDNDSTTSQIFIQFARNNAAFGCGQINGDGGGGVAFGSFSDRRLKENIESLPPQLDNILALRPVEFDFVESEGAGHQIGFIAQEIQAIYPDVVGEREPDGMLTVTGWSKTDARLVKAIQEQQAIIESLTARVSALEGN